MSRVIQSRQYPHMYYIGYPEGGRSYEYYNLTRARFYSIMINGTKVEPKVTGELRYQGFSKKRKTNG